MPDTENQIAVQDAPAAPQTAADMFASIVAMARDPEVDAAKIGHLVALQEQFIDRTAKDRWTRAFATACQNLPEITKDEKIEHNGKFIGWFKKYEDLRGIVDKIFNPLGLTISHDSQPSPDGKPGLIVSTVLTYMDDEFTWSETRGAMHIPIDATGAKSAPQGAGSSMTYGHRYSLCAAAGIVVRGLDKDGSTVVTPTLANDPVLNDAAEAASRGTLPYRAFFEGLTNVQRSKFVRERNADGATHHDAFKAMAEAADKEAT